MPQAVCSYQIEVLLPNNKGSITASIIDLTINMADCLLLLLRVRDSANTLVFPLSAIADFSACKGTASLA